MITEKMFKFKIEKSEETITSHSGLALCGEFWNILGLNTYTNIVMPKPGSSVGYKAETYITPMLLMLIGGGQGMEDIRVIKSDKALIKLAGIKEIPSTDAIGKWLIRMYGNTGYEGLEKIDNKLIKKILKKDKNSEYTLDPDATEIISEKAEAKKTYKGNYGYMPMLGSLAEVPVFIADEFREGNVPPHARAVEFLRKCQTNMPEGKRVARLRSDSAWYQAEIINICNKENIIFTITAGMDSAVKDAITRIKNWYPLKDKYGIDTGREVGEIIHSMNETKEAFRLIAQRWTPNKQLPLLEDVYDYYSIASNREYTNKKIEEELTEIVHWHNERGNAENCNKEIKLGFGMDKMPCGQFGANAVFFRLGVIAYNLMVGLKFMALPEDWHTKTIKTLRWQLLNIAGKVVNHAGQIILKLAGISDEIYNIFVQARKRYSCLCGFT